MPQKRTPDECERIRRDLFAMLVASGIPDRVLAGREAILDYLNDLGVRMNSHRPVTWNRVKKWYYAHGFPLLPGVRGRRTRYAAVTSAHAISAWLLSRPSNAYPGLFNVEPTRIRERREGRLAPCVGGYSEATLPMAALPHA